MDPPIAEFTAIAFRNASRVMTSEGLRSSCAISTMRRPVASAIAGRSVYGAGIAAHPVNDMPSASASAFIVEAVPIVLQCPDDGVDAAVAVIMSSSERSPAATRRRIRQMQVPEPIRASPSQ